MPTPKKIHWQDANDETRLSSIRGIGNTALQKLAASSLLANFSPKMTVGEVKASGINYRSLVSKDIRGMVWRNIFGDRQTVEELKQPSQNPLLPPEGEPPMGDPQLAPMPSETPEILALNPGAQDVTAKNVPTGMVAGMQPDLSVIPDVTLVLDPGNEAIHSTQNPAIVPQFPMAPASALGPQQGIVGARQVQPLTHEEAVTMQASGVADAPIRNANGTAGIGENGKGSIALENQTQERIERARGFRPEPMLSTPSQQSSQEQQSSQQSSQSSSQSQQEYKQAPLHRNFDSRIAQSKRLKQVARRHEQLSAATYFAKKIQEEPSFTTWNAYTQGVRGWAEPLTSANNYLDQTSEIPMYQYTGALNLMPIYDPAQVDGGFLG